MAAERKSKVYFFFNKKISLRNRSKLKKFIEAIFKREGFKLQLLNYIFCSDKDLLAINRQYLKHNYYTDIITFGLSDKGMPVEGEIYISVDRVRDNALAEGESLTRELHRVIFHGALHLCGYKDKSSVEKKRMREEEDKCLSKYAEFSRDTVS